MIDEVRTRIPAHVVAEAVAGHYGLTLADLRRPDRRFCVARPRFVAIYAIRQLCSHMSYPAIGRVLGGLDHTSVIHGYRRAESDLIHQEPHAAVLKRVLFDFSDYGLAAQIEAVRKRLRQLEHLQLCRLNMARTELVAA